MTTATQFSSRAVVRPVEAGSSVHCAKCQRPVKFRAKVRTFQVVANVYVNKTWNRVEHYHAECYREAGEPYGQAA